MGRHGHDGAGAVAGQYIFRNPYGDALAGEGIHGIGAGEDTRHAMVADAVALGAFLHVGDVFVNGGALFGSGQLVNEFALGSQHHEGHAEDGVGTGGEDGELHVAVLHGKLHLRSLRTAYPVALGLLQRVGPVDFLQSVEQSLGIGRHAQTPLAHLLLLHHGIAAAHAHAVHHLVVGQHRTQFGAPVHHRLSEIGDTVVHEHLLLLLLREGVPLAGGEVEFLGAGG